MNSRWILTVPLFLVLSCANAKLLELEKGSFCTGGKCEILSECSTVGDVRKNKLEICGFQGLEPIICCPWTPPFALTMQTPTSTKQPQTSTIRAPTWTKKPPTSTVRAPTSTKQPPTSTIRAPTWTKQPPTSTIRAPTSTKQSPTSTIRPPTSTKQAYTSLTHTSKTLEATTKPTFISIPTPYNNSTNYQKPAENKFKLTYTKGVYGGIRYYEDTLAKEVHNKSSLCNGGTCKLLSECKTIEDVKKTRPDICSFQGKIPIICCPSAEPWPPLISTTTEKINLPAIELQKNIEATSSSTSSEVSNVGEIARRKCLEYSMKTCPGNQPFRFKREERWQFFKVVVGGSKSKPRDLTFMAILGYGNDEEKEWACGATLISTYWVLGAAHCEMTILKQAKWIKLGDLDLESDTDDARPIDYPIQHSVIHPDYKVSLHYNDIALHKSKVKIMFNSYVMPICLETYVPSVYNRPWVAGWGMIEYSGARSSSLLQVELDFVRSSNCSAYYGKTKMMPSGIDYYSQICAGSVPGKDACQGDSGGPLFQQTGGQCLKYQVGITSFGKMCGKGPGVYTWILHYLKWIEEIVWSEEESTLTTFI